MCKQTKRVLLIAVLYLLVCIVQLIAFCNSIGFVYHIDPFSIETIMIATPNADGIKEVYDSDPFTPAALLYLLYSTPAIPSENQSYSISQHIQSDGQISIEFDESREHLRYKQIHILFYTDERGTRRAFFSYEYTEHEKMRAYIANKTLTPQNPDPLFLDLPANTVFTSGFFDFIFP